MKEKIKEKLNERINLILEKDIREITDLEFSVLTSKLFELENDENKEERKKKYAETIAGIMNL